MKPKHIKKNKKSHRIAKQESSLKHDLTNLTVVKQLSRKKKKLKMPPPGTSIVIQNKHAEIDPRLDQVFSRLHQRQSTSRILKPHQRTSGSPELPQPAASSSTIPLKKPRSELLTFLPPAGDAGDPDVTTAGSKAASGKKKRRKLNLLKRRRRRQDEVATADNGEAKLESAHFRYLNEQLYTQTGGESLRMFGRDGQLYEAYHQGFRNQVAKWPVNPLDLIIQNVNRMPPSHLVVDLGCGDARLAAEVRQRVHSFDLVAVNERVTACDMAHVPLEDAAANVVVLCLALMGTNLTEFLLETNRLLRVGGQLRIAEVASRFESVDDFVEAMKAYGFSFISQDLSHQYFYLFSMKKAATVTRKQRKELPEVTLKPCLYKRR